MTEIDNDSIKLEENGFAVIEDIYSEFEIGKILTTLSLVDSEKETFRKSKDLFAIRQFLKEVPAVHTLVFNENLKSLISRLMGDDYFIIKSIYFDKPQTSNWYVSYHQDLTISVDKKSNVDGFGPWTTKQDQFAVQPPIEILKSIYTIRIHLDDTDKNNGALKIIPGSHLKGIYRPETIDWSVESEVTCDVKQGGVMLMKPLLLHSSGRTTNNKPRRVIHIEFSNALLTAGLNWSEYMQVLH